MLLGNAVAPSTQPLDAFVRGRKYTDEQVADNLSRVCGFDR